MLFMETRKPSDRNILLSFNDANIKARSHGVSPACFLWKPGNPQTGIYCFPSRMPTSRLDHMEQALPAFYGNQETLRQEYTAFLQ